MCSYPNIIQGHYWLAYAACGVFFIPFEQILFLKSTNSPYINLKKVYLESCNKFTNIFF